MKFKKGFTLIELLVVIAVITALAGVVLASFGGIREKTKIARVQSDLEEISKGILLLQQDTGKWPLGCPPYLLEDPENNVGSRYAGIKFLDIPTALPWVPQNLTRTSQCTWTAQDVAKWNGPYYTGSTVDPWGEPYYFDPDFCIYDPNNPTKGTISSVIGSYGPSPNVKQNYKGDCGNPYRNSNQWGPDTDDIVKVLEVYPVLGTY